MQRLRVQRRIRTAVVPLSTDGFQGYSEAVDLGFGPFAKHGIIVKDFRSHNLPGAYTPAEIIGTKRRAVFRMEPSEVRTICTSHVERNNLTIRTFLRRFTRLAMGFSKKLSNLEDAVALFVAYYDFCWRPGKMRITPAMAAGACQSFWTFNDLMSGTGK